jgi:predicted  nucleic acid-binding Zn-ribbon protein
MASGLEERFAEIEKRVKALVTENRTLKDRILELEQDLIEVRKESQKFSNIHGKQLHIREKIERVLHSLESVGVTEE